MVNFVFLLKRKWLERMKAVKKIGSGKTEIFNFIVIVLDLVEIQFLNENLFG